MSSAKDYDEVKIIGYCFLSKMQGLKVITLSSFWCTGSGDFKADVWNQKLFTLTFTFVWSFKKFI